MVTTRPINRSDLMRLAWAWARQEPAYGVIYDWTPGPRYGQRRPTTFAERRAVFADCLRRAWAEMKARAQSLTDHASTLGALVERSSEALVAQINDIENRSRICVAGWRRLDTLQAALRVVRDRETRAAHSGPSPAAKPPLRSTRSRTLSASQSNKTARVIERRKNHSSA